MLEIHEGRCAVIIKEIKHFKLSVGKYTGIDVGVPCSVVAALHKAKLADEPYSGILGDGLCKDGLGAAVFAAEFDADAMMFGMENLILRIGAVDAPALLYINSSPIARLSPSSVYASYDIKRLLRLGKNKLEIRFDGPSPDSKPEIPDAAIYAPIELISFNKAIIDEVIVRQEHGENKVRLDIEVTTKGYTGISRAVAVLVSPGGAVNYCTIINGKGWLEITNPNLWRPGRLGAHSVYKLTVNLYSGSELTDTRECKVGLYKLVRDEKARPMLSVSDAPFYPAIALHGSPDYIKPRATDQRLSQMLTRARDAGVDMIYYRGGASYPSKKYLDLCDELGIALAIDLSLPVGDLGGAEKRIVAEEIDRCIRHLANHPSVMIIVANEQRLGLAAEIVGRKLPSAICVARLELNPLSPPSLMTEYTSAKYIPECDRNLYSASMEARSGDSRDSLISLITREYRLPHSFSEWTYLSGIASANAADLEFRRLLMEREGIGALCCELCEPLPGISPSVLDYSLRLKPMYYYMARSSGLISIETRIENGKIDFYVTNMQAKVYKSKLVYAIKDKNNKEIVRDAVDFAVDSGVTSLVYTFDASAIISERERECYLYYYSTDSTGMICETTRLFVTPRMFDFADPKLDFELAGANTDFTLTIKASAYAAAVTAQFDGDDEVVLDDNCIDIVSDVPVRIKLKTSRPTALESLKRDIRIYSLYGIGR